jgi:hypothetical protein
VVGGGAYRQIGQGTWVIHRGACKGNDWDKCISPCSASVEVGHIHSS